MKKSILKNLKNIFTVWGAFRRNPPLLVLGILAAAFVAALSGCEGMWGLSENISNNTTGDNGSTDIILTNLTPQNAYYYLGQTDPVELNIAVSSLANASGEVRFDWYTADMTPGVNPPIYSSDPVMPGTFVKFNPLAYAPVLNNTKPDAKYGYFAQAVYPAVGIPVKKQASNTVFLNLSVPGDTDKDGYPDDWEKANYHEESGVWVYNPYIDDMPYGIDLSLAGAAPDGIKLAARTKTGYDEDNEYIVLGLPYAVEYMLYASNPNRIWADHLTFAADANSTDDYKEGSLPATAKVYVSEYLNNAKVNGKDFVLYLKTEGESGGNLEIESGANVTIALQNVNLTGGAPIIVDSGATLTLKLQDNNYLEGGVVYNEDDEKYYAAAGIQVPAGATLTIQADTGYEDNCSLTALGGKGDGDDSYGAAAGIGGGYGADAAAGNITINSGAITATGGDGKDNEWGGAAGIGGGGDDLSSPNPGRGSGGTIKIDLEKSTGTATAGSGCNYGVGPGEGGDPSVGSFNGGTWPESTDKEGIYFFTWPTPNE